MPATATLTRRDGVELIRTGRWPISTGEWTATRDDLTAAVAAMSCPAVRKPVIKVGHTDKRFTPGDGEPTIGWLDNLQLADGGHTLLGDYVGVPAWLDSVMASAFPDRSVEGSYNHRCQLGHTHPFVLTGVALLGVTPPGVGTLKSLNDVAALYGITASQPEPDQSQEVRIAASVSGVALRAAAEQVVHTGAMIALIPTDADAARLAVDGGEPADELHVTLAYLGQAIDLPPKLRAEITDAVHRTVSGLPPVDGQGFAVSAFNPPGMTHTDGQQRDTCLVLGVSGTDLADTHTLVTGALYDTVARYGVDLPPPHRPWVPHLTLTYSDDLDQLPALADRAGPVTFDRLRIAFAGEHVDIPLTAVDGGGYYGLDVPGPMLPVAAAGDGKLRDYWLRGEGAAKVRWGTGGDFTRCVRHLRKHVTDPEGLCAEYHHEATGMWPGDRRNVHASEETPVPNPTPTLTERIHQAWNAAGQPEQQWIVEAAPDEVIVMDNTDRSLVRVPVTVDGDAISFGAPQRVRTAYVAEDQPVAATRMVFASAEESRPATTGPDPAGDPTPDVDPAPASTDPTSPEQPATGGQPDPELPAAEPEQPTTPDPTEDPVTDLSEIRSRLGLADDANPDAILAAVDALKTKADAPTPNTKQVAAAAEAARGEMRTEIQRLSGELATIKAAAAADVKKALFDSAVQTGRLKPADRQGWEDRYDKAPDVIADILASIAPNTEVPVAASGYTGQADPVGDLDAEWEQNMARLDGVPAGGN